MSAVLAEVDTSAESSVLRLDRETRFAGVSSGISSTFSVATSTSAGFDFDELDDLLCGDGFPFLSSVPVPGSFPSLEGETRLAVFASGISSST